MRLILGRHGKAAHNAAFERFYDGDTKAFEKRPDNDVPLLPEGKSQAQVAGVFLREKGVVPNWVYHSPALRAKQTWQGYCTENAALASLSASTEPRLAEQNGGDFDRLALVETEAARQRYTEEARHSFEACPPGGESIRDHLRRVQSWLNDCVAQAANANVPDPTVLAVCHYGTIGLLGFVCENLSEQVFLQDRPEHLLPGYGGLLCYVQTGATWRLDWTFDPVEKITAQS